MTKGQNAFRWTRFGILALLLLIPPAIGQAKTPLMIYTSVPDSVIVPIIKQFEKENPDIKFRGYRSGTNYIINKIQSDLKTAGRIKADLIWVADPAYFIDLKEQGLLLKYTPPMSAVIPSIYKDPDGFFTAGRILNMGIIYNTQRVTSKESPKDWEELLETKWQGKIGMPDPNYSGSTLDAVEALSSKYGWEFFKKLRKNGLMVINTSSRTVTKVAEGDVKVAIALDFITRNLAARGKPLGFNYPKSGAVSIASPVAIINSTRQPAGAKRFIDFILSNEGQRAVVQIGNLYSVNPLFAPPKGAPAFKPIADKALPIDWRKIKVDREKIIKQFSKIVQE